MRKINRIKKTIICILFLGFLPYISVCTDISSYKFKINFDTTGRKLNVDLLISLKKTDSIEKFLFSDNISINVFRINNRQIKYKKKNDTLTFNITPNENEEIHINYTYPIDSSEVKSGIIWLTRFKHWYPADYDNVFDCQIKVNDLSNYYIIASGEKTEANGELNFNAHKIESIAIFLLNKNIYIKESRLNNKLNCYRPKNDTINRDRFYQLFDKSYKFYSDFFNKEPFKREFEIIEMPANSFGGAQSFQNIVVYDKSFIDYFYKYNYNSMSHEVAHQWWGNSMLISSKKENGFFIMESLTEYLKCIFVEKTEGKDEMKKLLYSYMSYLEGNITKDIDIAISDIKGLSSSNGGLVLYYKGPLVAYCLSKKIGEEKFLKILIELYNKNTSKMIDYQTFLSALRENNVDEKTIIYLNEMLNTKGLDMIYKVLPRDSHKEVLNVSSYISHCADVSFYKFKMNFDTTARKLDVDLLISFNKTNTIERFLLSDIISIKNITINNKQIIYNHKNDTLSFSGIPNENKEVHVSYTLPVDSFKTSSGVIYLKRDYRWYPVVYNKVFGCEITINDLPNYYIIASGGKSEKTEVKGELNFNANKIETIPLFILNKNNFKKESRWNNKLNFYTIKTDTINKDIFYQLVEKSYKFYTDFFHKEPFKGEFEIIEFPETDFNLCQASSNTIIYSKPYMNTFLNYNINWLSHKVAQQWWGINLFFNLEKENGWFISESITEYLKLVFVEKKQGDEEMGKLIQFYMSGLKSNITKENDVAISDIKEGFSQNNRILIFNKGCLILYCLSRKIGEDKLLKILADMYNKNIYTEIDYQTFLSTLRENNVDEKTIAYLNEMLNTKGLDNIVKDINSAGKE